MAISDKERKGNDGVMGELRIDIGEEYEKLSYGKKISWGRELELSLKRIEEERYSREVEEMARVFEGVLIKHGII